jgi:hypothetical protein
MGKNARALITVRSKVQVLPGPLHVKALRHFPTDPIFAGLGQWFCE